jgi:hypothetical protein
MVLIHGATLSIARAARAAGVTRPTMYRHIAAGHVATEGKRVDVKSLALYMQTGEPQGRPVKTSRKK